MSLFPFNIFRSRKAQTSVPTTQTDLYSVVRFSAGSPAAADDDRIVTSTNMKVGAYTIANGSPSGGGARNVTVTHTAVDAADTLGTIVVVGTDLAGAALTETITPSSGGVASGTKAFKTVTSVTGAGWVIAGGNDTIKVGFGDLIGLPDKLPANTVLAAYLNGVREATAPTVTTSTSVLASNTADLNSSLNGNPVYIVYII